MHQSAVTCVIIYSKLYDKISSNWRPNLLEKDKDFFLFCLKHIEVAILYFQVLYEGHLSASIMFMYSPKACDQQLCLEASPTENHSFFCHSPHALMLEVIQNTTNYSIKSDGPPQIF